MEDTRWKALWQAGVAVLATSNEGHEGLLKEAIKNNVNKKGSTETIDQEYYDNLDIIILLPRECKQQWSEMNFVTHGALIIIEGTEEQIDELCRRP